MGVDGVYARTALYEGVVERLESLHLPPARPARRGDALPAGDEPHSSWRSPAISRASRTCSAASARCTAARPRSAPRRTDTRRGGDWTDVARPPRIWCCRRPPATRCIRSRRRAARCPPAACCSTSRPTCFRHEPSRSLDRLQSFRMREFVRIGSPEEIVDVPRALDGARAGTSPAELALPHTIDVASDPFFGRVGQIMAVSQRQQALKFELLIPYHAERDADRVHELQLSPRALRQGVGHPRRPRRARAHRLRGVRHRPAGGRAVRQPRARSRAAGRRRRGGRSAL